MARIPTYEIDPVIHDLDMLLGTDHDNQDHTKSFKLSGVAEYVIDKLIDPNAVQSCIPVFRNVSDVQGGNAQRITSSIINQNIYPNGTNISIAGTLDAEKQISVKGDGADPGLISIYCDQNSHYVSLRAPGHGAGATYTLELPDNMGVSGQVLTTNGLNKAHWTDKDDDDLNIAGDTNTGVVDLDTQTLTISGGTLINTSVLPDGGQNITIQHDSVNRTDVDQSAALAFGDSFNAISAFTSDQGGHTENVTTHEYTLPSLPSDNVTGTGTPNTLPIWDATSQQLGDSIITQTLQGAIGQNNLQITNPNVTWSFNYGGSFKAVASGGDTIFDLKQYDGSFFNKKIKFNEAIAIGQTSFPSSPVALSVAPTQSGDPAAYFKGGIVLSNNPGGVQVDNTSMVIGAGNNDVISGCDNSLAVGNGNQIQINSDNSVSIGTSNLLRQAKNSLVVGLGNSITLSSPGHSIVQGQNNTLTNSFSSFVAGGNNTVNVGQNAFVLGYSHDLTGADSFVVLGENNESTGSVSDNNVYMIGGNLKGKDGTMVLGFRNDETSYPATDYTNGLGNTKFVIGVGTDTNSPANNNAVVITEGGVTRGGAGVLQVPRVVLPTVVNFNFADDTAAAAAGIPVGGVYHSSGVLKIRIS